MLTLLAGVAALVGVLLVLGRYNEVVIEMDWAEVVTPAGRGAYEDLRTRFSTERAALDITLDHAASSERAEDAADLLAAGYTFLEHLVTERRRLLDAMAKYSRLVGAIAPVPPLCPGDFRLRELATIAGVGAVAHHLLITVPERLRLRMLILRAGLGVVLRAFARVGRGGGAPDWQLLAAARSDWNTVSYETLASFRALVTGVVLPSETAAHSAAGR